LSTTSAAAGTSSAIGVVGHGDINPDRADPQGFDWDRFNRLLNQLSTRLGALLGDDFKLQ
jgi:hypothetical protein